MSWRENVAIRESADSGAMPSGGVRAIVGRGHVQSGVVMTSKNPPLRCGSVTIDTTDPD
jgi:hypothetical protein